MQDSRRFFILTLGRTGSSLLASILSDAGADFDGLEQVDWDRTGGAYEHPDLVHVVRQFRKMDEIGTRRPMQLLPRLKWDLARHNAKKGLKKVLSNATYLKGDLAAAVHWSARLGYDPTVILSYRRFGEIYKSIGHMHPQLPDFHAHQYVQSIRNGLGLVSIYGGCAVDYDEVSNLSETGWISAVSQATGLSENRVSVARNNRVEEAHSEPVNDMELFPECAKVYEMVRQYRGQCFQAARATKRMYKSKRS